MAVHLGVIVGSIIGALCLFVVSLLFLVCVMRISRHYEPHFQFLGHDDISSTVEGGRKSERRITKSPGGLEPAGINNMSVELGAATELTVDVTSPGRKQQFAYNNRRAAAGDNSKETVDLMSFLNKVLRLLFALSGLLTILLSVVLDNSFNDQPVRFTAFGILAPFTIFFGFLASGWFPRISLWLIAFVKRRGFLKHVMPCSPWHDNVLTDFCGELCILEPMEQPVIYSDLPQVVRNFLYGDQILDSQGTTVITQSPLDPESADSQAELAASTLDIPQGQDLNQEAAASTLDAQGQDLSSRIQESKDLGGSSTGQVSSPNIVQEAPSSQVADTVVQIDPSDSMFHVLDYELGDGRVLAFEGPPINGYSLKVDALKNTSTKEPTFDLSFTFRNKKTRRMYLKIQRLQNLAQNMCQWVKNPHPIVVKRSLASDVLHCMAIQDILWEFTKGVYTLKPVEVQHRYLAGMGECTYSITISYVVVSFLLALIPLLTDKRSLFFLFFLLILVPYLFIVQPSHILSYYFKFLFSPVVIKLWGFNRLYKSRSFFVRCNEFRKQRVVNPRYFWIDQDDANRYSGSFADADSCFESSEFVEVPDNPTPKNQSFFMICQGWPGADDPTKCPKLQHAYKLRVIFDTVKMVNPHDSCYTNVKLSFFENDDLLGNKDFPFVDVKRLHLIEKLFHCYSDPSFGGYVETISPGFRSRTFLAHCPRFLDICEKFISDDTVPTLLVAWRKPGSKISVGDSFLSSTYNSSNSMYEVKVVFSKFQVLENGLSISVLESNSRSDQGVQQQKGRGSQK